ncbi:hypothetical protein GKE82_23875 [Conexibacter sp. W3-3-2]|uniref:hypothetical protein n=1 Tax=Conexibacter sp. W3-3-2 TaxID=2675227 RepID=UPI0012B86661|nr:hypothetical protein [Conexibacter sp. W3-3-2]MTD47246.1 hypothetical protein [Conexibacter sp. W3-3-2]
MTVTAHQARIIIATVTAIVAGALALMVIKPSIDDAKAARDNADRTAAEAVAVTGQAQELRLQIRANSNKLAKPLRIALPQRVSWGREFTRLTRLAEATKTSIVSFEPGAASQPSPAGTFATWPASLTVECEFLRCLSFLGGMQGLTSVKTAKGRTRIDARGPIWYVDSLSFSSAQTFSMALTAGVFVAPEAQADPLDGAAPAAAPPADPAAPDPAPAG